MHAHRGFCRHQVPGFGPWHRAYMRQFELALIQAARTAAAAFQDDELRAQYAQVAETIRLPYWDWCVWTGGTHKFAMLPQQIQKYSSIYLGRAALR